MKSRQILLLSGALTLLWLTANSQSAGGGWFGFAMKIDAEGISLNPVLRSITIQNVVPGSPAARAGVVVGDSVLEIQGIVVAGTKADVLKAAIRKSEGETLRLKLGHGAHDTREVSLIAVQKPPGQ